MSVYEKMLQIFGECIEAHGDTLSDADLKEDGYSKLTTGAVELMLVGVVKVVRENSPSEVPDIFFYQCFEAALQIAEDIKEKTPQRDA